MFTKKRIYYFYTLNLNQVIPYMFVPSAPHFMIRRFDYTRTYLPKLTSLLITTCVLLSRRAILQKAFFVTPEWKLLSHLCDTTSSVQQICPLQHEKSYEGWRNLLQLFDLIFHCGYICQACAFWATNTFPLPENASFPKKNMSQLNAWSVYKYDSTLRVLHARQIRCIQSL